MSQLRPFGAGALNQRVTIQQATKARGATFGDETKTWADLETVWAKVAESASAASFATLGRPQGAAENIAAFARPHRVWIRYRADVTHDGHRLIFAGRTLHITGLAQTPDAVFLEIQCIDWSHD